MTTTPTPASQLSPLEEAFSILGKQPSPARSDTITVEVTQAYINGTAEQARSDMPEAERALRIDNGLLNLTCDQLRANLEQADRYIEQLLAERAPSGEEIATWQERCDWKSDEPATKLMVEAMKAEIADLRAALARRATAGNAAPTDADENAPWLTLAHTICADAGIQPGHITDRLNTLRDLLEAALRGNATPAAAPGDLAPLPERDGDWAGDDWYTADSMHDYGRACIASNAGAAPSIPGRQCMCRICNPHMVGKMMFICPTCGDKRCPHAADHRDPCGAPSDTSPVSAKEQTK